MYRTAIVCVVAVIGAAWGTTLEGEFGWNLTNATSNYSMNGTDMMNVTVEPPVTVCSTGYFSPPLCNETCASVCGMGNDCDPVNGTCRCNSCWEGMYCTEETTDTGCFDEFLKAASKESIMCERFGCSTPMVDAARVERYMTTELLTLGVPASYIRGKYEIIDRSETMTRDLAKVSFTLDNNRDRVGVERYITELKALVKRGDVRCTLAVQDIPTTATEPDTTDITMNI